jgi:hypothetical protein
MDRQGSAVKRRERPDGEVVDEVPGWVLTSASINPAKVDPSPWLLPGETLNATTWLAASRRMRAEGEAWCAERRLSYCRVVLGWQQASPAEVAAGRTRAAG